MKNFLMEITYPLVVTLFSLFMGAYSLVMYLEDLTFGQMPLGDFYFVLLVVLFPIGIHSTIQLYKRFF